MAALPLGPEHNTACLSGQTPDWWCGAQHMLYQEWLWVNNDIQKRANTSHLDQGDDSDPDNQRYIGAGVGIVVVVAILWLMIIMVRENVRRREVRRRILVGQGGYDDLDDMERALRAEREERERGQAPAFE